MKKPNKPKTIPVVHRPVDAIDRELSTSLMQAGLKGYQIEQLTRERAELHLRIRALDLELTAAQAAIAAPKGAPTEQS